MPIYEYCCQDCGHRLEAIQRLADAPLTDCPACSHSSLKKQVSAPSFRLSGGGWYETDFKTGDKKKNLAGDRGGASSNEGSSKQSGESGSGESAKKPAEKSAAPAKSEATKAS
ncbi:MAG: zinc ribbon domain-containing protein [Luminiphilus sp.]